MQRYGLFPVGGEDQRFKFFLSVKQPLPDIRDIDPVILTGDDLPVDREGKDPPVDSFGAIAFCGKFITEIRKSSQHFLA